MTHTPDVAVRGPPSAGGMLWVYGYALGLPGGEHPLREIRAVVTRENRAARRSGQRWAARLIVRPRAAQMLVVGTGPADAGASNRHLEAALTTLGVGLLPMLPMPVVRRL
jgi:hypothetical protein